MSSNRVGASLVARLRWFVRSVERGDESMIEDFLRLSRSRRLLRLRRVRSLDSVNEPSLTPADLRVLP